MRRVSDDEKRIATAFAIACRRRSRRQPSERPMPLAPRGAAIVRSNWVSCASTLIQPLVDIAFRWDAEPFSLWAEPTFASRESLLSLFLEAIANAIEGFDHFEFVIDGFEFLAQPLDVTVDIAVVNIDLIVIGRIH